MPHGGSRASTRLACAGSIFTVFVAVAGCSATASSAPFGGNGLSPSASVTSLIVGWEHYFTLTWEIEPEANDRRAITGYVHNQHGRPAVQVQLLAQALDANGELIGQRLVRLIGDVPALSRAYFKVDRLPAADRYRVTVWAFTFVGEGQ